MTLPFAKLFAALAKLPFAHGVILLWAAVSAAARRAREDRILEVAGSLTFTTILSIVPLATIGFAILTTMPVFAQIQINLHDYLLRNLLPAATSDTVFRYLNQFSERARGLTLIGLVFLGVTAVTTMFTIDDALNTIWRVRRPRPLARRVMLYWAVLTLGPVLLALSLSVTSYLANVSAGVVQRPSGLETFAIGLIPIVLMSLFYAGMYVYVPNRPVRWKHALTGGLCAAIAFDIAKRMFAVYITRFPTYTTIYGALAALPIFLLWVYLSWMITLFGAAVAASLPTVFSGDRDQSRIPGQEFCAALRVLSALSLARGAPLPGLLLTELAEKTARDLDTLLLMLEKLESQGIIVRTRPITQHGAMRLRKLDLWILAIDCEHLPMERLFALFAFDAAQLAEHTDHSETALRRMLSEPLAEVMGWTVAQALGENVVSAAPLVAEAERRSVIERRRRRDRRFVRC